MSDSCQSGRATIGACMAASDDDGAVRLTATQRSVVLVASVSLVGTAFVAASSLRFVYSNLEVRVALETAQGLVAFLAAGLLAGRYRRTSDRRDLVVCAGLVTLGSVALVLAGLVAARSAVSEPTLQVVGRWLPLTGQVVGASAIGFAALSRRRTERATHPSVTVVGAPLVFLAALTLVLLAVDDHLPTPIESLDLQGARYPRFEAHPLVLMAQGALVVVFAVSAWAFAWRTTDREQDALTRALAIGSVLAAAARLSYLLYPVDMVSYVHLADVYRLGFYVVLAAGAAISIRQSWEAEVVAASFSAREQLARELHDGLAQELGFIASQTSSLASGRGDPALVDHIAMAAERARNEARRVIDALEGVAPRPLGDVIRLAVEPVADRGGAVLRIAVDPGLAIDPGAGHEIAQLAREATSNAVRHGGANSIAIEAVVDDHELRLTLTEDGCGFERGSVERPGFGIRSMEQRAFQLGGNVVIRSAPGHGSTVELAVPFDDGVIRTGRRAGKQRAVTPRRPAPVWPTAIEQVDEPGAYGP